MLSAVIFDGSLELIASTLLTDYATYYSNSVARFTVDKSPLAKWKAVKFKFLYSFFCVVEKQFFSSILLVQPVFT